MSIASKEVDNADLDFLGRKGNTNLGNFRLIGKSKHQQYFTSNELSATIAEMLKPLADGEEDVERLTVLDPTCGSGRLLLPWKKSGAKVLGIELDKDVSSVARRLLGKNNVRNGDLLSYANYLNNFNIVVTNPPYGIWWDLSGVNFDFEAECYGGSIESQSATMEIATRALTWNGILAAVIPTTTFTNPKDSSMRKHIYSNYSVLLRATLQNVFKAEYGINIVIDLVIAVKQHSYGERQNPELLELDVLRDKNWKTALTEKMKEIQVSKELSIYPTGTYFVPSLETLNEIPVSNEVHITPRGASGDLSASAHLDLLNHLLSAYNPIHGIETGIKEAYFEPSSLVHRGADEAQNMLACLGFKPVIEEKHLREIERLKKRFHFLSTPIYAPKPHQLLAYYFDKDYTAKETVSDKEGNILFEKGKSYHLRPTWIRRREVVKIAKAHDERRKKEVTITTEVDQGYLAIRVNGEQGEKVFQEITVEEMKLLTKAFPLPVVEDVDIRFPERVERNRRRIADAMPFLFDYQQEDLARLALKPFGYVGYEMGGGKTVSAAAWAVLRHYKAVLVVCQSSLVMNWMNELKKFGFNAELLSTHTSIDRFKAAKRKGFSETTFFVTSYEFLSLDPSRKYDPWDCIEYDRDGNIRRSATEIRSRRCPACHKEFKNVVKSCPKCEESASWTGAVCGKCGYVAYSYSKERRSYPAYRRIKKLFDCVIVDEAQMAKTKNSGRGRAVRALKSKGKLILTGTLMKGYITDIFWNVGWILGFGNPLFPYNYVGGSKQFLNEFGTFEYVTKQFEDTLSEGRAKMIPEVSNLNRFWRTLASFTVRRLKDEMVKLPEKHRHILLLPMDAEHQDIYSAYDEWATKRIQRALQQAENEGDVNMGIISSALWKLRFAGTVPNATDYLCNGVGPDMAFTNGHCWNKLKKVVEIVKEVRDKGDKVIVFSGLRPMVSAIMKLLRKESIGFIPILASHKTSDRFKMIQQFSDDPDVTAIVAGLNVLNRGFTITAANNVIITDIEYSPEATLQAEDRAHRTGQTKEVNVYYLFSQGTIDEIMFELVSKKQAAISNAIDGRVVHAEVADFLQSVGSIQLELAKRIVTASKERPSATIDVPQTITPTVKPVVSEPYHDTLQKPDPQFKTVAELLAENEDMIAPRRGRNKPHMNQLVLF